jgi:hypothetical protein
MQRQWESAWLAYRTVHVHYMQQQQHMQTHSAPPAGGCEDPAWSAASAMVYVSLDHCSLLRDRLWHSKQLLASLTSLIRYLHTQTLPKVQGKSPLTQPRPCGECHGFCQTKVRPRPRCTRNLPVVCVRHLGSVRPTKQRRHATSCAQLLCQTVQLTAEWA